VLDESYVYCTGFNDHGFYRAPKAGGTRVSLGYVSYPIPSAIVEAGTLYFVSTKPNPQLWKAPPNGQSTLVKEEMQLGTYSGLALSPSYYYTLDNNYGIRRIHRVSLAVDRIYNTLFVAGKVFATGNRLYFTALNPQLAGPNYIVTCVD
jgi:hypothetical protein